MLRNDILGKDREASDKKVPGYFFILSGGASVEAVERVAASSVKL